MFKDLKKIVSLESTAQEYSLTERLHNKPFWIWNNIDEHRKTYFRTNGSCCFNHIIGLPTKEGVEKAMFDYEKILYDSLLVNDLDHAFKHKHPWVKKSTGLGVTEFFLRLMAHQCQ
jgi:hypothetical protein